MFKLFKYAIKPNRMLSSLPMKKDINLYDQKLIPKKFFMTESIMMSQNIFSQAVFTSKNLHRKSFSRGASSYNLTHYTLTEKEISTLLEQKEFDFMKCEQELERLINHSLPALNTKTNPVILNLSNLEEADLKFFIQEYSGFSNETIHMFLDAKIRLTWDGVKTEIDRNVSEEMGVLTKNIPHLELMRQGYRTELGIETDNISYTATTNAFVKKMRSLFQKSNNAFTCGALLAFEATATCEFKAIEKILRTIKAKQNGIIEPTSITGQYIAAHVNDEGPGSSPEDDHYAGMRSAIAKYITRDNANDFIIGFVSVCNSLSTWWEKITVEIYENRLNQKLLATQKTIPQEVSIEEASSYRFK
jgi:hypothetical protein